MALINVGGIGPLEVTRHVWPDAHVFEWVWRGDNYFLNNHTPMAMRNSTRITDDEYYGRGDYSNAFNQMRQAILAADGRGAFDNDDQADIPPPDDGGDMPDDPIVVPGPGLPDPVWPGMPNPGEGPNVIALSALVPIVATRAPMVLAWLRGVVSGAAVGSRVAIPGWVRTILTGLGVSEIVDIFVDIPDIDDLVGFPSLGGGGSDPHSAMVEAMTVSTWNANGVKFHRLSDGRLAVRNKHGVWKIWRPKKPIVLMPTGQADLKDLIRADKALQKQAGKLAKMLRGRGYSVSKK